MTQTMVERVRDAMLASCGDNLDVLDWDKLARAAIEAMQTVSWQPIDTAPKNETVVLVSADFNVVPAYWAGETKKCWRNWFRGVRYPNDSPDAFLPDPIWFEPTHWMPMPDPPA